MLLKTLWYMSRFADFNGWLGARFLYNIQNDVTNTCRPIFPDCDPNHDLNSRHVAEKVNC